MNLIQLITICLKLLKNIHFNQSLKRPNFSKKDDVFYLKINHLNYLCAMYRKWVKIALILIYLVIIAGAVVRMTGSGMGCPDWPKCFGYYIPPTEETQLLWHANQDYFKGQVIILEESLKIAKSNFTTGNQFKAANWSNYNKHDYATFNATHTWVEYINRLLGALSGLAVLIMTILAFASRSISTKLKTLSVATLLLLLFQAWLGATVVYSVLSPVRITIHMIVALIIVGLLLYILKASSTKTNTKTSSTTFNALLFIAVILSLIQVALGTQVRQFVDEQVKLLGYSEKSLWLSDPDTMFYIHRSFSIVVLVVNVIIFYLNKRFNYGFKLVKVLMAFILLEILTGIAMYYLDFPFLSQPLHLVIAALLFGVQFYILLQALTAKTVTLNSKSN